MSAWNGWEVLGDGVVVVLVFAGLIALAVACAPPPARRWPALARRPRDIARY